MKTTKFFAMLLVLMAGVFIFESCSKKEDNGLQVTTLDASEITPNSAKVGGMVYGSSIGKRYVSYGTSPNDYDRFHDCGSGAGIFVTILTGLMPSTTYYYHAIASNDRGVSAGEEKSFTTEEVGYPEVTTAIVSDIAQNSASCGGFVRSFGGGYTATRGVCWSTSSNPTIADGHTTDGQGIGPFVSSITGLTANTKYFVRAYAINSLDTGYGGVQNFTTLGK